MYVELTPEEEEKAERKAHIKRERDSQRCRSNDREEKDQPICDESMRAEVSRVDDGPVDSDIKLSNSLHHGGMNDGPHGQLLIVVLQVLLIIIL